MGGAVGRLVLPVHRRLGTPREPEDGPVHQAHARAGRAPAGGQAEGGEPRPDPAGRAARLAESGGELHEGRSRSEVGTEVLTTQSGYVDRGGRVALLAATNRRTATRLLWEALASSDGPTEVGHVTAANEWAVDVGMAARLDLHQEGYLALRDMKPPAPYLHNGVFL